MDIGNETIKVHGDFGSRIEYLDQFGVLDSREFEKDILKKAISKALGEIKISADIKKAAFLIFLPPNLAKVRITVKEARRKDGEGSISGKEKNEILENILEETKREVAEDFAKNHGILPQDLEFLDQEIIGAKIDGYEISDIQGYKGESLEFRVLSFFIPKYYLQSLRDVIVDLGIKNFKIIHPAQKFINVFEKRDGIFLDIGGQWTQIFLVRNNRFEVIDDFSMGGRDFSEAISHTFGLSHQDSRNLKERYSKGELSEFSRGKMKEIFADIAKDWLANLKAKLKNIKGLLPSTLFIFGGGSRIPEIEEVLNEDGWEVRKYEKNFGYHSA